MRIHPAKQTITAKVVYYGPGLSGKTTNLVKLHERFPSTQRGALVQLDTETERTLFFDYFPATLGKIRGYRARVDFFTVPGQSFYHATRRAVLEQSDGVVFVADSSPDREEANLVAHDDMLANLNAMGQDPQTFPVVYQWNKRDVRGAIPVSVLEQTLNPHGLPSVAAEALNGVGVWVTHAMILGRVFEHIRQQIAPDERVEMA